MIIVCEIEFDLIDELDIDFMDEVEREKYPYANFSFLHIYGNKPYVFPYM
jgi:hypothetical protein